MCIAAMLLIDHKAQMLQIFDSGFAYLCFLHAVSYQNSGDKFETFSLCRR